MTTILEPIDRLSKDLKDAAKTLTKAEVRFLVDDYYMIQDARIRAANQYRALSETEEPGSLFKFFHGQQEVLETRVKQALQIYVKNQLIGQWMIENYGIGPVISAGLLAHIDIDKVSYAGQIWSYCGLAPGNDRRKKGEKATYNPTMKRLCWLIGESFVKVSGKEDALYGQLYRVRKDYEIKQNEAGAFKAQAEKALTDKNYSKDTEAYKSYITGKLPPAHIHARAKRFAVKIFLAHLHEVWKFTIGGTFPPRPYVFDILGHGDYIEPPHQDIVPGLREALNRKWHGHGFNMVDEYKVG